MSSMQPADLSDEMLDAIHRGGEPLYFKDRPAYYSIVAETIAGWSAATNSAIKALIKDAQRQITRGAPTDAG
jgi:hypothetical protein